MFEGDVYYCWSCDAHCRAVPSANSAVTCPRCREHLGDDCRLEEGPRIISFLTRFDSGKKTEAASTPGLWPTRAAAMH